MEGLVGEALSQVTWIIVILVALSVLALSFPFILRKFFSRQKVCSCGQKLISTDAFCPKCGKKVEK